jgi:hypothetical protein
MFLFKLLQIRHLSNIMSPADNLKLFASKFTRPKIEASSCRRFAMPSGLDFTALKALKRRNDMAKRLRGPPS